MLFCTLVFNGNLWLPNGTINMVYFHCLTRTVLPVYKFLVFKNGLKMFLNFLLHYFLGSNSICNLFPVYLGGVEYFHQYTGCVLLNTCKDQEVKIMNRATHTGRGRQERILDIFIYKHGRRNIFHWSWQICENLCGQIFPMEGKMNYFCSYRRVLHLHEFK